ncbi:MAG: lipocalin-like domain-containing protein [Candidatus Sulfotelmatobacter sp.]
MASGAVGQEIDKLVGTWKLVSASSKTSKGEPGEAPYGLSPAGFLTYTAEGRVTALISYGGRKALSGTGGTVEEQAEAFKTFLAYAGRYTLAGDKVTHTIEVSSIQNYVDRNLVRSIQFQDDRLILITPPTLVNGKIQTVELIWQRLQASA